MTDKCDNDCQDCGEHCEECTCPECEMDRAEDRYEAMRDAYD